MNPLKPTIPPEAYAPAFTKPPRTPAKAKKPIPRVRSRPKKKKRSKGKPTRGKVFKECDRLWSLIVRSKGRCELCGSAQRLQGAHGFSRRYWGTRWNPLNGFCLCSGCHIRYTYDALGWLDILKGLWGLPVFEELWTVARATSKPDPGAIHAALSAEAERIGVSV